jgi:hypothetical protein
MCREAKETQRRGAGIVVVVVVVALVEVGRSGMNGGRRGGPSWCVGLDGNGFQKTMGRYIAAFPRRGSRGPFPVPASRRASPLGNLSRRRRRRRGRRRVCCGSPLPSPRITVARGPGGRSHTVPRGGNHRPHHPQRQCQQQQQQQAKARAPPISHTHAGSPRVLLQGSGITGFGGWVAFFFSPPPNFVRLARLAGARATRASSLRREPPPSDQGSLPRCCREGMVIAGLLAWRRIDQPAALHLSLPPRAVGIMVAFAPLSPEVEAEAEATQGRTDEPANQAVMQGRKEARRRAVATRAGRIRGSPPVCEERPSPPTITTIHHHHQRRRRRTAASRKRLALQQLPYWGVACARARIAQRCASPPPLAARKQQQQPRPTKTPRRTRAKWRHRIRPGSLSVVV